MAKVLLLDFDSVMVVNSRLKEYQLRRSAKFVQQHTNMHINSCEHLNRTYYPKFGHSVIMVNEMFNKNILLEEYDDFVFSKKQLSTLDKVFDDESKIYTKQFQTVYDYCENNNIECFVFTNAHQNWITHFSDLSGLEIDKQKIIWPHTTDLLKPKKLAYTNVEKQFGENTEYLFVDDSAVNLNIPKTLDNWRTHLFHPNHDAFTVLEAVKSFTCKDAKSN